VVNQPSDSQTDKNVVLRPVERWLVVIQVKTGRGIQLHTRVNGISHSEIHVEIAMSVSLAGVETYCVRVEGIEALKEHSQRLLISKSSVSEAKRSGVGAQSIQYTPKL